MKKCRLCNEWSEMLCTKCNLCWGCCNCDDEDIYNDYIEDLENEYINY
jgi:hypothetical protein